ncbi:MAG: alkaline phosphatase D family protein [Myxococcota bacterium]|nr:alkaline phosphatase D family protein [Deltaproteobacteria bacterium]MDQ3341368.1 alkaline phosphatase D family protein [Myxococcota bacterium]
MGEPFSPTRRDWLRIVGAGTATIAIGCGDNGAGNDVAAAIFEPTHSGFLVAVWARTAREATIAIGNEGMVRTQKLALAVSGSSAVDITDLDADTSYDVVVIIDGAQLGPHRVRTAPRDDDTRAIRLAVTADVDPNPEFDSDLVEHVIAAKPDLLVTLGDFPYTDNGPPAMTVADYRERHIETRVFPRVRSLLEAMPVRAIYDDHEFRNDWDTTRAANEAARYAAAIQTWDEFFPLRDTAGEVRYRKFRHGANVECFLLDCRRFRSQNDAPDVAGKTMLGDTQRQWLFESLAASTATFKLVLTSVPLDFAPPDSWTGFVTERAQLFEAVVDLPGVLFVSADQHYFAAHRHAFGIREFQVGPLCRGLGTFGAIGPGVLFRDQRYNVGLVDIERETLTVTGLGPGGDKFYSEMFTPADLTARR